MRPVSLSDETLDSFDADEMAEFENLEDSGHGRRRGKNDGFSIFDEPSDEDVEDALSEFGLDAGIVDHD